MGRRGKRVAPVAKRPRGNFPTAKKNGVSLPVHIWELMDQLVSLNDEAYKRMGGTTKWWLSDELRVACESHLREFAREHGPLPQTPEARDAYVTKLVEYNRRRLRDDVFG